MGKDTAVIVIRGLCGPEEAEECARMMAASEPWLTLGRGVDSTMALMSGPEREVYVALYDGLIAGALVLSMRGALAGYIQAVYVAPDDRGSGIGTRLIAFAEDRIFSEHANVFLCVSDFNMRARALYERLGYETVGALRDYVTAGRSEILMRKTRGPIDGYGGRH